MVTYDTRQTLGHGGITMQAGFDLSKTYVRLGLGSRATPIPDFEWT